MKQNLPVTQKEKDYGFNANILSTTNLKGSITHFNQDFLEVSGFEADELMHKNHNIIRHPDMPPAAFADLWSTVKAGKSWMGIVKNRCKNGDHYWVDAYVTPVHKDGEIGEYQSVRRKPSREYVNRAEALYQKLLKGSSSPELKPALLNTRNRVIVGIWVGLLLGSLATDLLFEITWLMTLPLILGAGASATLITWWALKPLGIAVNRARAIFDNPIARHVYTGRNDDIGSILLALKSLESDTDGVVGRIADDAESLLQSASELSAVADKSGECVRRQFQETDQVASAIAQMTGSIKEVGETAQQTADTVGEAMQEAHRGRTVVAETASAIQALSHEVETASEVISRLESSTQEINSIVDVIRGIADQTNLLALNAAIEAARAGEQGRGFAVVADEVRTLASRTNDSTEQIKKMIESLQSGTTQAVDVMNSSRDKAMQSVEKANSAAGSIDAVGSSVEQIKQMSVTISSAVEEQSAACQSINQSMQSMREVSQWSKDASEDTTKASDQMSKLADGLKVLVQEFWNRKSAQPSA